jgi:hypothetical protein
MMEIKTTLRVPDGDVGGFAPHIEGDAHGTASFKAQSQ